MSENDAEVGAGGPELVETGNYPDPVDGAQDHIDQSPEPQFDEDLLDPVDEAAGS